MDTGRISREIEFEFSEDTEAKGAKGGFVATGQVRSVILRHLHLGEVDAAAKLLSTAAGDVGDLLLGEDAATASLAVKTAMADMFAKAGDFERAGKAAILIGDPARAAPYFEQSYQYSKAAELYEKGGKLEQAADLYQRDLKFDVAAQLFEKAGKIDRAAEAHEKAGRPFESGQLWAKARRLDKAVEVLQKIDLSNESYTRAVVLLGRILENAGHRDAAAGKYLELVKTRPIDAVTVDAFERLAEIYVAMKQPKYAYKLLMAVVAYDPARERALKVLGPVAAEIGAPVPAAASTPAGAPPHAQALARPLGGEDRPSVASPDPKSSPSMAVATPMRGSSPSYGSIGAMPAVAGAVAPLVLPPLPGAPPPPPPPAAASAPAPAPPAPPHPDIGVLKELPLFSELSLEDMRGLAEIGERCSFGAGETIIEQDTAARYFLVVFTGVVRVMRMAPDGMFPLAELGVGAAIGEMALVDEGSSSARVRAHTDVTAFRWPLEKLRGYLATHDRAALRLLRVISRTLSIRLRETNRRLTT